MSILDMMFGRRTPKGDELLGFMREFGDSKPAREELKRYISGADVAILSNGEPAQPFADLLSLSIYTATGKPVYRSTINIREPGITVEEKHILEKRLAGRKIIVVDLSYNETNEAAFRREFTSNGYRIDGLMYFSPFPTPYARDVMTGATTSTPRPDEEEISDIPE